MSDNVQHIQSAFTAGEISPRLLGRADLDRYQQGLQEARNMVAMPHGGIARRSGTRYVADAKQNTIRLVGFEYSVQDSYVLEFGDQYIRFYRDGGQLEDSGSPYEISSPWAEADLGGLSFFQSADILYVLHQDYAPREVRRAGDVNWSVATFDYEFGPWLPINEDESAGITGSFPSMDEGDSETVDVSSGFPLSDFDGNNRLIRILDSDNDWVTFKVTAVDEVNDTMTIECQNPNGTSGIGGGTNIFEWQPGAWYDGNYPTTGTFFGGRMWLASTPSDPQTFWGSRVNNYKNYAPSNEDDEVADSDGLSFKIDSDQVNAIRWIASNDTGLILGTQGGEWVAHGGARGSQITANSISVVRQTNYGSESNIAPVVLGHSLLFVQRGGSIVREMFFEFQRDQHIARDVSILAEHLTDLGLTRSAFQKQPASNAWYLRSDNVLISLAFHRDHDVFAWSHHDFSDDVLDVATIHEGGRDVLWIAVDRGGTTRVEFMEQVFTFNDHLEDAFLVDSGLSREGWNSESSEQMKITGGATWEEGDTVSIESDFSSAFSAGDVDKEVWFRQEVGGDAYRLQITSFTDDQNVDAELLSDVPSALQDTFTHRWAFAVDEVSGLDHLDGREVSLLVDGAPQPSVTVSSGTAQLETTGVKVHAGLFSAGRIKTVPLVVRLTGGDSRAAYHRVYRSLIQFYRSIGVKYGREGGDLTSLPFRRTDDKMGSPPELFTGLREVNMRDEYDFEAVLVFEQESPTPMHITSLVSEMWIARR